VSALNAALAALFDLAPKCDACREHVAVQRGEDIFTGGHHVCDREACGEWMRCEHCAETFDVDVCGVSRCPHCDRSLTREPRSTAWRDLPHADSLRAANAAYEARR
jgi:hypothetical protein